MLFQGLHKAFVPFLCVCVWGGGGRGLNHSAICIFTYGF
jgi:hypothetical protein